VGDEPVPAVNELESCFRLSHPAVAGNENANPENFNEDSVACYPPGEHIAQRPQKPACELGCCETCLQQRRPCVLGDLEHVARRCQRVGEDCAGNPLFEEQAKVRCVAFRGKLLEVGGFAAAEDLYPLVPEVVSKTGKDKTGTVEIRNPDLPSQPTAPR